MEGRSNLEKEQSAVSLVAASLALNSLNAVGVGGMNDRVRGQKSRLIDNGVPSGWRYKWKTGFQVSGSHLLVHVLNMPGVQEHIHQAELLPYSGSCDTQ